MRFLALLFLSVSLPEAKGEEARLILEMPIETLEECIEAARTLDLILLRHRTDELPSLVCETIENLPDGAFVPLTPSDTEGGDTVPPSPPSTFLEEPLPGHRSL